jgi:PhzF family phenazine biosynthesis protein
MKYYVVDAFTDQLFKGNPAGVCLLEKWIDEERMQLIAFENNLAETAFLVKKGSEYELRWFTPECEIDLCGHATLASGHIILNVVEPARSEVLFHSKSGALIVKKSGDMLLMDFPARKPVPTEIPADLDKALGAEILEAHLSRDLLVVVKNELDVAGLDPNFELLKNFKFFGIIVTAKGISCDFVSRYFAPSVGVPEDPVTGSSHSTLIPFWSERLGKTEMQAKQLSKRGGSLYCRNCGDRVVIGGKAVQYLSGEIIV